MTEKKEKKKGSFGGVFDAIVEQTINELTRPAIRRIFPEWALNIFRTVHLDKVLPLLAVGLNSIFTKEKYPHFASILNDLVAEGSAELRRLIVEGHVEPGKAGGKPASKKKINMELFTELALHPQLESKFQSFVTALADVLASRADKDEKDALLVLLGNIQQMGPEKLMEFLSKTKAQRDLVIKTYFDHFYQSKETAEEKVKKLVEDMTESRKELKLKYQLVVKPFFLDPAVEGISGAYRKIDNTLAINKAARDIDAAINRADIWATNYRQQRLHRR